MTLILSSYDPIHLRVANVYKTVGTETERPEEQGEEEMSRENPHFETLILAELARRLVGEVTEKDVPAGDTLSNYRFTCAIDALVDHLGIEVSDDEAIDLIPFGSIREREEIRAEMEHAGLGDDLLRNLRREKALRWLCDESSIILV